MTATTQVLSLPNNAPENVPGRPGVRVRRIKFNNESDHDFHRTLRARVADYFDGDGFSRFGKYANAAVALKAAVFIALAAGAYTLILTSGMGPWALLGLANLFGVFAEAAETVTIEVNGEYAGGYRILTASYGQLGRADGAGAALERLLQLSPGMTLGGTKAQLPFKAEEDMARFLDGLSAAGLKE